jgi:pectate lyase
LATTRSSLYQAIKPLLKRVRRSIIGVGSSAIIEGGGFSLSKVSNVIIRNLVIRKVKGNDAITIQKSNRIWIDHNEFYSDTDHGFDYYDGQVDITHADDYITVSCEFSRPNASSSLLNKAGLKGTSSTIITSRHSLVMTLVTLLKTLVTLRSHSMYAGSQVPRI